MHVLRIVFSNFTWVDGAILLLAIANGVVCALARREADRLYNTVHLSKYIPTWRGRAAHLAESIPQTDEEQLVEMRRRADKLYSVFTNIISIFPLLGIFGTVWSLIPMVENLADMQQNFFAALTSTFRGLVFAIAVKLLDATLLSAKMDDNEKSVALYLDRAPEMVPEEEKEAAVR